MDHGQGHRMVWLGVSHHQGLRKWENLNYKIFREKIKDIGMSRSRSRFWVGVIIWMSVKNRLNKGPDSVRIIRIMW